MVLLDLNIFTSKSVGYAIELYIWFTENHLKTPSVSSKLLSGSI